MSGDEDLEPLEQAPQLGGLGARISDAHVCADADLLEALEQGRMEGKCQKPRGCLEAAEWSKAALMAPLPGSFEFVAQCFPLVKLPLPDLPPTLETAHVWPPEIITTEVV